MPSLRLLSLRLFSLRLLSLFIANVVGTVAGAGQQTPVRPTGEAPSPAPITAAVSPGLWRLEGTDAGSGIHYVRLFLTATGDPAVSTPSETESGQVTDLNRPTLTGQCTRDPAGKLHFELFANFGAVLDPSFYPPWHNTGATNSYPPVTEKLTLTLDFLGYTKVKPYKRQFERTVAPGPAQLRYLNPGHDSANMEPPGWFFQYLRALPTLRLSDAHHTADFLTPKWIERLHQEPLCSTSGA